MFAVRVWNVESPPTNDTLLLLTGQTITNGVDGASFVSYPSSTIYIEAISSGTATLAYSYVGTGSADGFGYQTHLDLAAVKISLAAAPGKVHHGFDPPCPEEVDPGDEPYWASVIKGGTNGIVNLVIGLQKMAGLIECRIASGDEAYVDISPKTFSSVLTQLTITGKTGDDSIQDAQIEFVLKLNGEVLETLKVMVLPPRTLEAGIYTVEDSNSVGTKLPSWIPSASNILDVCNDVFKQAGISFTVHSSSGARNYPYDTRGFVDLEPAFPGMMMSYNTNAHPRAADNSMSWQEYSAFFSTYNIAGYTPAVESICECFALSNTVGMAIINKGTMGYEGPYPSDDTPPYIRGTKSGVVFAGNVR